MAQKVPEGMCVFVCKNWETAQIDTLSNDHTHTQIAIVLCVCFNINVVNELHVVKDT